MVPLSHVLRQWAAMELVIALTHHARAMKQVDPTIKIFWNDNDLDAEKIANFLKITGPGVMDGAEFHGAMHVA
eukprot:m.1225077 g.1225077  ORF g.1225077 m.1225077 type:complete len:73 (+) comp24627_c0_seq23:37-255(+)